MNRRRFTKTQPMYQATYTYGRGQGLRRRRSGAWIWGCGFLTSLTCVASCFALLILTPIGFRLLPPERQQSVINRLPFMEIFLPTREYASDFLPTVDPARGTAASALLSSPTPVVGQLAVTLTPTFAPTATAEPLPPTFHVSGAVREPQTWNNCGPANTVQALRLIGVNKTQQEVAGWMKPNYKDGNVSPWQISTYVSQYTDARAMVRYNGNEQLLKRLTFAGFGLIIETGFYDPKDRSWLGHYLTVVGWDDGSGFIYGLDSYEENGVDGMGVHEQFADLDARWMHFNRVYVVLYRPDQESKLRSILGTSYDPGVNAQEALAQAVLEAQAQPTSPYAWFNIGTSSVLLKQWAQATAAYDRARSLKLPWRFLWYQFGPYKAYYETGDYQGVIDLTNATLKTTTYIEESFYYRGLAYAALGVSAQAVADLQQAAQFNPNFTAAQTALTELQSGSHPDPATL